MAPNMSTSGPPRWLASPPDVPLDPLLLLPQVVSRRDLLGGRGGPPGNRTRWRPVNAVLRRGVKSPSISSASPACPRGHRRSSTNHVLRQRFPPVALAKFGGIGINRVSAALSGIIAVAVGLPLLSAYGTSSIAIPHNDDWAFSRVALTLADTGRLELVGWGQMNLIGHVLWAQPFLAVFGRSQEVLHVAQAVAAATGLLLAYLVLRVFLARDRALFATAVFAAFPGYALLSTGFMTDTTAFAAQMGCVYAGLLALEVRKHTKWFVALSVALGFFAFTIREIALAAPLAVLVGRFALPSTRRNRREISALIALVLLFAAGFSVWRHTLPDDDQAPWLFGHGGYYARFEQLARAYFTCAFAALPALLLALPAIARDLRSRRSLVAAASILVLGAVTILRQPAGPFTLFTGNLLTRQGAVNVTLSGRQALFPPWVWIVLTLAALLAGALLAVVLTAAAKRVLQRGRSEWREQGWGLLGRWLSPQEVVLAAYAILPVALIVVRAASGVWVLFDRYLWGIEVPLFVLVLALGSSRTRDAFVRRLAAGAATLLMALSLVLVVEEQTTSAARWSAGEHAVSTGIPATDIDAGFEWMGWHYQGVAGEPAEPRWRKPASWYNVLEFPASANCIFMSFAPRSEPSLRLLEKRSYRPFFAWGRRYVFVYRNEPACRERDLPQSSVG
jgi:hypothetical protein